VATRSDGCHTLTFLHILACWGHLKQQSQSWCWYRKSCSRAAKTSSLQNGVAVEDMRSGYTIQADTPPYHWSPY
jgi:hypothetical protein